MQSQNIDAIKAIFHSRLTTLEHILKTAATHFNDSEEFLERRLAADMFPLSTQIIFTCNQPWNFALWCDGQAPNNLDPTVTSLHQAYEQITKTKEKLTASAAVDSKLNEVSQIPLGESLYLELSGRAYVDEFLMPNFYFHLVTTYDILRMAGVPLGKRDYMLHLIPGIRQVAS